MLTREQLVQELRSKDFSGYGIVPTVGTMDEPCIRNPWGIYESRLRTMRSGGQ